LTSPIGGRDSSDSLPLSGEQTTHEQPRAIVAVNHGRFIFMSTMRAVDAHQVYRASSGVAEGESHFSVPGMWASEDVHDKAELILTRQLEGLPVGPVTAIPPLHDPELGRFRLPYGNARTPHAIIQGGNSCRLCVLRHSMREQ
jgi:hypothetical protein